MNRAADWLIGHWLASRFNFSMRLREGRARDSERRCYFCYGLVCH